MLSSCPGHANRVGRRSRTEKFLLGTVAAVSSLVLGQVSACLAGVVKDRAWNFAYGSNMEEGTRRRRGLEPLQMLPGMVKGWELTFSLPGVPYLEPAFAALRPASANCTVSCHGLCLELDTASWLRLLQTEGVLSVQEVAELSLQGATLEDVITRASSGSGRGYRLAPVRVDMYKKGDASASQLAYTLAAADDSRAPLLPPSVRYWRLLRNGARKHGLDRSYRDFLASLPRYAPSQLATAWLPRLAASADRKSVV